MLGGTKDKIDVGISIGIQSSPAELVKKVEGYLTEGYKRIKIKISPGNDIQFITSAEKKISGYSFTG